MRSLYGALVALAWGPVSTGMSYVLVNGKVAIDDGKYTGVLAGKALKHALPKSVGR